MLVGCFLAAALLLFGCNLGGGVALNGGAVEAGGDGSSEADAAEDGAAPLAGPLTLLAESFAVVAERVCDVDGDGDLDDALSDLGSAGTVAAGVVNGIGSTDGLRGAVALHFPWVDDLSGPDAPVTTLIVSEVSQGADGSLSVRPTSVDGCLEPLHWGSGSLRGGAIDAAVSGLPFRLSGQLVTPEALIVAGQVEPFGSRFEAFLCGVNSVRELGDLRAEVSELSFLELIVAGGAPAGVPGVPGVEPDIDLDGDGLEQLEVDDEGRLVRCIDGDATVIEGRDCWRDPRIADGLSFTVRAAGSVARLDDIPPPWRQAATGACAPSGPEASRWGSCGEEACEHTTERPCEPGCGEEGRQLCRLSCGGFGPCLAAGERSWEPTRCDEVTVDGDGASCSESPFLAQLVNGPDQRGALGLPEPIVLGSGALVVEAAARLSRGSSETPCCGWGIAAYLDVDVVTAGDDGGASGLDWDRVGYAVDWSTRTRNVIDDEDRVRLRASDGPGEAELTTLTSARRSQLPTSLDSWTEGTIEEALRLVLIPDLPETVADEQAVFAHFLEADGEWSRAIACYGDECPIPLSVGDEVAVGVIAGTRPADSIIDIVSFRVEAHGLCP